MQDSGATRMLKFSRSHPTSSAPADADTDNEYMVTVKASHGSGDAMVMDELGRDRHRHRRGRARQCFPFPGDATAGRGHAITATLTDDDLTDEDTTDTTWQWSKSMATDGTFTNIDGATSMTYTPVDADAGYYLRASATYSDDHGTGKEASATTGMAVTSNSAPTFDMAAATRDVAENTAADTNIGDPVPATDPDGDTLTYTLGGTDAASFGIVASSGQLQTKAELDYETKSSYMVTVTATDPDGETASIDVTINVTNVDEDGTLTLSSMDPMVGTALTATLAEGDAVMADSEEWGWSRSMTADGTFTHIDADMNTYTPTDADVGYYLRVTVMYNDGHGAKTLMAETASAVPDPLFARYDENDDGEIQKNEMIAAVNDYLYGEGDDAITQAQMIGIVNHYLFGNGN